ncbi:hypothetical protein [Pleionea sediminis]|uniref:hypothetical protein n=1 Tax=Pleionea sediminis TaxID=2569479 RepID=UPI0011859FE7|nr:hypothetical protein [Pleionea sediminis]
MARLNIAEQAFKQLKVHSAWHNVASYYLGLVYRAKKDTKKAIRVFRQLAKNDSQFKDAAIKQLQLLSTDVSSRQFYAWANVTFGYESNPVALSDDFQISSSSLEDNYRELTVQGAYYLTRSNEQSTYFSGYYIDVDYDTFESLSSSSMGVAGNYLKGRKDNRWRIDFAIDSASIASRKVYLNSTVRASYQILYDKTLLKGSFNYTSISASTDFKFLGGERAIIGIETQPKSDSGLNWLFGYSFEWNDRQGLINEDTRRDYSPVRHQLSAKAKYQYEQWTFSPFLKTQWSNYSTDDTVINTDGEWITKRRQSKKLTLGFDIEYEVLKDLEAYMKVIKIDNKENIELYEYTNDAFSLGIRYTF